MTPADLALFVEGWSRAQAGAMPDAPSADDYAELVKRYG